MYSASGGKSRWSDGYKGLSGGWVLLVVVKIGGVMVIKGRVVVGPTTTD